MIERLFAITLLSFGRTPDKVCHVADPFDPAPLSDPVGTFIASIAAGTAATRNNP